MNICRHTHIPIPSSAKTVVFTREKRTRTELKLKSNSGQPQFPTIIYVEAERNSQVWRTHHCSCDCSTESRHCTASIELLVTPLNSIHCEHIHTHIHIQSTSTARLPASTSTTSTETY